MNSRGEAELGERLTPVFERSMRNNFALFDRHAFRKHTDPSESRNVLNIALFDVYSVLMTRYSEDFVARHRDDFIQQFYALQQDEAFRNAITISTNDVRNVAARFEFINRHHSDLLPDMENV